MFSRSDAEALRGQLAPVDFQHRTSTDSELVAAYRAHYNLDFRDCDAGISHQLGTFESGGYTLVCQYFALPEDSSRGCALLLHGYFDHAGLFAHLIRHCLSLGNSVVIFDLPGHGLSSGPPASIHSFEEYSAAFLQCLSMARNAVTGPWQVLGQSTGGAVILDAVLHRTDEIIDVENIVLLCPLLYPVKWSTSRLLYYLARLFAKSTPRRFAINSHDEQFLRFIKNRDALQSLQIPVLWVGAMIDYQRRFARATIDERAIDIIQGTDDGTVDWQRNLKHIVGKFPNMRQHLIPGAKHHLVNESQPYRDKVLAKISEILQGE